MKAPPASAEASAISPKVEVEPTVGTFTRSVTWSKPGAWLVEVRDGEGNVVAVEAALNAEDAFLLLDEHVIPPEA